MSNASAAESWPDSWLTADEARAVRAFETQPLPVLARSAVRSGPAIIPRRRSKRATVVQWLARFVAWSALIAAILVGIYAFIMILWTGFSY